MKKHTDRQILSAIYNTYEDNYLAYDEEKRASRLYVPIDCEKVAKSLSIDSEILFGRLYYHLDKKYGYQQDDGSYVHLFALKVGGDRHAIHFPLLASVLAELEESHRRFTVPLAVSAIALSISVASFVFNILK